MAGFVFRPRSGPFPEWSGPFTPSTGKRKGYRVLYHGFGAYVSNRYGSEFARVLECPGLEPLMHLVRRQWGGGRLLILPNGMVVKPHQDREDDRVNRSLLGSISGSIVLGLWNGSRLDLARLDHLTAGDRWPGPDGGHLSCKINPSGALRCTWYHPTTVGRDYVEHELRGADRALAEAFREARDGATAGRVQVCYGGYVITRGSSWAGTSECRYVGRIDPDDMGDWETWIKE